MWTLKRFLLLLVLFCLCSGLLFSLDDVQRQEILNRLIVLQLRWTTLNESLGKANVQLEQQEKLLADLRTINAELMGSIENLRKQIGVLEIYSEELQRQIKTLQESLRKYDESSLMTNISVGVITGIVAVSIGLVIGHVAWK